MNIEELIHDLRARINPQYYDQIGTESYERHQVVMALEYLRQENERQHFDILAMNQSLDLLREENARLRKWVREEGERNNTCTRPILREICENCGCKQAAIDAARRANDKP